jgi:prophage tail gpP-like protein
MPIEPVVSVEPVLDRPEVRIGGSLFDAWEDLNVVLEPESQTATFRMSVGLSALIVPDGALQPRPLEELVRAVLGGEGEAPAPALPGSLVEISLGRDPILRAIVDSQRLSTSAGDEKLTLSGRCVLGVLQDSTMAGESPALAPQRMKAVWDADGQQRVDAGRLLIEEIATELVETFQFADGTPVFTGVVIDEPYYSKPLAPLKPPRCTPGERCAAYLKRLAVPFGYSDLWVLGTGELVVGNLRDRRQAEREAAEIRLRLVCAQDQTMAPWNNLMNVSVTQDVSRRFHETICLGASVTKRSRTPRPVVGRAVDPEVGLNKRLHHTENNLASDEAAAERARELVETARCNGLTVSGTAAGFGQRSAGVDHLFLPNRPVSLVHQLAGINWKAETEDFYLSRVTFDLSASGGPRSTLSIKREVGEREIALSSAPFGGVLASVANLAR